MTQESPNLRGLQVEPSEAGAVVSPSPQLATPARNPWPYIWAVLASLSAVAATTAQFLIGPTVGGFYLPSLCLAVCILAAWFDAATAIIPKELTYTAILAGLTLNSAAPVLDLTGLHVATFWLGSTGPGDAFLGFALCAAIALACRVSLGMAGGDMKLLAAVGAMMGFHHVRLMLLAALFVSLPYAAINLLLLGRLNAAARVASCHVLSLIYLRQPAPVEPPSKTHVPLAVPLLLGLLLARAGMMNWLWSGLQ